MSPWRTRSRHDEALVAKYEELFEDAKWAFDMGDEDRAARLFEAAERVRDSIERQEGAAALLRAGGPTGR